MESQAFFVFTLSFGFIGWLVGRNQLSFWLPAIMLAAISWAIAPTFRDDVILPIVVGLVAWRLGLYRSTKALDKPGARVASPLAVMNAIPEPSHGVKDYRTEQRVAWERVRRRVQEMHRLATLPEVLDASNNAHIDLAIEAVAAFGIHAMDTDGEFSNVVYRPMSLLPYPAERIRESCELLLDIADQRVATNHPAKRKIEQQAGELGVALECIENYLGVPAAEIPLDPLENFQFGMRQLGL